MAEQSERPIADSYWVQPGRLLAGEYPGARDNAQARARLARLLDAGITAFVDLTELDEYGLNPYVPLLAELASETGTMLTHRRAAIRDMGTPTHSRMVEILDLIDELLARGENVYVHCFGGIGRTGTVVGCHLVRNGMMGEQALAQIARWRAGTPDGHRASPETERQRRLVLSWYE